MVPLSMGNAGEKYRIRKVGGLGKVRLHLEELGFVVGATVTIVTVVGGNLIVAVKDSRIAMSQAMAQKILV